MTVDEPRTNPLPPGFDDVEPLTATGCGQMYRARVATADGRAEQVSVTLVPTPVRDRGARRRLRSDCLAAAAVNAEPGVLAVRDLAFTDDHRPLLITDLAPYGTLADRLDQGGPLSVGESVATGLRLARALVAAHREGVLHLGIAPDAVFATPDGPVLGHFGLAWAVRPPTQPDIPAESIVHAPRELFGWEAPTVGSDVYGLASVLRTAITGQAPFLTEARIGRAALYHRLVQGAPPTLHHPGVPQELATLLDRMMVPDPARRPGPEEIVRVLEAVSTLPGFATVGRPPAPGPGPAFGAGMQGPVMAPQPVVMQQVVPQQIPTPAFGVEELPAPPAMTPVREVEQQRPVVPPQQARNDLEGDGASSNVEYLAALISAPTQPAPTPAPAPMPAPMPAPPAQTAAPTEPAPMPAAVAPAPPVQPAPIPAPMPAPLPPVQAAPVQAAPVEVAPPPPVFQQPVLLPKVEPMATENVAGGEGRRGRNTGLILVVAAGAAALAAGVAWGVATGDRHQEPAASGGPVVMVQTFDAAGQVAYQVSDLKAQAAGTSVTVTWSAPTRTDGVSSYVVVAGLHDKDVKDVTVGAGEHSVTITGLQPRTQYCFSVITLAHPPGDSGLRMAKPNACYQATTGSNESSSPGA